MTKCRKWIAYVLFAAVACSVFLYLSFPSEAVHEYLEGAARGFDPPLDLRIDKVKLVLPFGLELEKAVLSFEERPKISLFKADTFVLMPSVQTLALWKPALGFNCTAYGGKIQGVIALKRFSLDGPFESDIEITGVRLGEYPFLRQWLKRDLTGAVSGNVIYGCSQEDYLGGSGKADFSILGGSVRFVQPFLGMESLDFHRIDAGMVIENQEISLVHLEFKGKQMEGKASGTIHLNTNLPRSLLDLKVAVKPLSSSLQEQGDFFDAANFLAQRLSGGNLKIAVRGTIARPRIKFI